MADNTLIKMKTGTIAKLEEKQNGNPKVALDEGSVYFAVDTENEVGKIVYDVANTSGGVSRIVMGTQAEYADKAGALQTKRIIDGIEFDGSSDVNHYNVCSTAAATAAKTVACNNFYKTSNNQPITGSRITVKFSNTNTAANPTLSVNGTAAKPIQHKGVAIQPQALSGNGTYEFIYDGTAWQYIGTIAVNTGISIDDASYTMFITSPIINGDGVSY